MSLSDDDAKEIIKTLALRRDNARIILGGFIAAVLTFLLVILTMQQIVFELTKAIHADVIDALLFMVALLLCVGGLLLYVEYAAIKNKIKEISKQHDLEKFYADLLPEEQKISTARERKASVSLGAWQFFAGVFLIIVGVYVVWQGYALLNNFYSSLPSSMTGLNIIIVPLETTALYIGGLLLVILGLFMIFGKDKVLNWVQKIKIA